MSRFRKKDKSLPPVSTAALPDIVFMLLFFFMVIAQPKSEETKVSQSLPVAVQLQKLEDKDLTKNIFIGYPTDVESYGAKPRIQFNDVILPVDQKRQNQRIQLYIKEFKNALGEKAPKMKMAIKSDGRVKMKVITDIKQQFREANTRRIIYNAGK